MSKFNHILKNPANCEWIPIALGIGAAVGSLAGGTYSANKNASNQRSADAENWRRQQLVNKQNYEAQKEFYQNSIQWRKQDALQAGINPIYALGASSASFSPSFQASYQTAIQDPTAENINNAINAGISTYQASKQAQLQEKINEAQISAMNTGEMKDTAQASYYLALADQVGKSVKAGAGAGAGGTTNTTKPLTTKPLTTKLADANTSTIEPNLASVDTSQEGLTGQARMIVSESPANASKEAVEQLKKGKFSLIYNDPANYHRATLKVYDNFEQWAEHEGVDLSKNLNYKHYSPERKKDYQLRIYIDYLMNNRYSWWQTDLKREFKREIYKEITGKEYKSY